MEVDGAGDGLEQVVAVVAAHYRGELGEVLGLELARFVDGTLGLL